MDETRKIETQNHIHKTPYKPPETEVESAPEMQRRPATDVKERIPSPARMSAQESHTNTQLVRRSPGQDGIDTVPRAPNDDSGQQIAPQNHQKSDRNGAPAVRLDMNLDVDIQLKAKIQGYITLSIL